MHAALVVLTLEVGLLLLTLPWTPLWTRNFWLLTLGPRYPWLHSGWVRGIVSGLGLINLWTATSEISPALR